MQRAYYMNILLLIHNLFGITYGYFSIVNSYNINGLKSRQIFELKRLCSTVKEDDNPSISNINTTNNLSQTNNKRVPIGSVPEFAIENDNTEETSSQRFFVYTHFIITMISMIMTSSTIPWNNMTSYIYLLLAIISSIILGDLGTGIFHWSVDNYGSLKTPLFGSVCVAFQGHHKTPWTITFRSFVNNVYKISYSTIPALLLTMLFIQNSYLKLFLILFINWWLISQEFHKFSHMKNVPSFIKYLQDSSIILSRKEHGLHHNSPFEGHYCILTGICNPILDKFNVFRHLEKLVYKLTGNKPITWKEDTNIELKAMSTTIF